MRGSHLEPGHYVYVPLYLTVNSSVLVLREECEQVDFLRDDFRILVYGIYQEIASGSVFCIQPLALSNSKYISCVNATIMRQ